MPKQTAEPHEEPWIPLKLKLPPPNVEVEWYDGMFDKSMIFAMADPAQYDPDFTHWKPVTMRPIEWDSVYGDGGYVAPPIYYRERDYVRENRLKLMATIRRKRNKSQEYYAGAKAMCDLIWADLLQLGEIGNPKIDPIEYISQYIPINITTKGVEFVFNMFMNHPHYDFRIYYEENTTNVDKQFMLLYENIGNTHELMQALYYTRKRLDEMGLLDQLYKGEGYTKEIYQTHIKGSK